MRFDINLASQPYQDARVFYMRWGSALVLAVLLTLGLIGFAVHEWMGTRDYAAKTAQVRRETTRLERERTENEAILNRPENRGTRERSQFLNTLIARKSFSWTQVFSDLEKIVPAHVHVLSITPELKEDRQIEIKMRVAGESRERNVELARKLEQSRRFRKAQVRTETTTIQSPTGDKAQADITAIYVPSLRGE